MGLFGKSKRIAELEEELAQAKSLITPELLEVGAAKKKLSELEGKSAEQAQTIAKNNETIVDLNKSMEEKRAQIVTFDDEILVQEYGLYEPRYEAATSSQYADTLKDVRDKQKAMIKSKGSCTGDLGWTVNGSKAKGRKMINDIQKLLMRSYNTECDETMRKVKYGNFDASEKRIKKSAEQISRLGKTLNISISDAYVDLKIDELHLVFQYARAKEEEKEEKRLLREQEREEAKLKKEIEAERKRLMKEQLQYVKELANVSNQLLHCGDDERVALEEKMNRLQANVDEVEKGIADVDYRQANIKAGYVYIISNIGSFGSDIYKIGMTRRLDPMERVNELGDASVPFRFDVHAMIFSDDAPKLEAALHNYFSDRKVNLVNQRREYFKCTLDEIKQAVKENFDKTVEFIDVPDAEQYRISKAMREKGLNDTSAQTIGSDSHQPTETINSKIKQL